MRRCAAVAIDLPLAAVVVLGPLLALDRILQVFAVPDDRAGTLWLTAAVVWTLVFVLGYSPVCVSRWGGTLGKRTMGVEVVRASDGARLGYGPAVLRHIINLVVTTVPIFLVAHVSAINLSASRRGMHDKAVGSAVIHRR
ncbi:RDD family protein [Streptomyces sp. M2CJ-2]|uniref:RDD family protein n=1 Tax=Streptomyces sp. M2CJ-2 TaxID=2803948 RepID=UPI001920F52A|nr:RDD family protein [Streptomyces sp. M2CJ-2]MBL3665656.1 RDD family protein [Streptomyces sp. M2CJ-2]